MCRKGFSFILLIAIGVWVCANAQWSYAEQPQVTMTFDRRSVTVNEEIKLVIRIEGSQGNLERPRLPAVESFTSYYTGRSTQTKYESGRALSVSEFTFVLVPKAAGKFTFPEIEVAIDDQVYSTAPVMLEVLGDPSKKPGSGVTLDESEQTPPPAPSLSQSPQTSSPSISSRIPRTQSQGFVPPGADPDIFVKVWVDKEVAYPNEPILMTYSLYTRKDTQYEGFQEEPVVTGFWIEQFSTPEKLDKTVVNIAGKRFVRADIRKMALFPQGSGTFTIIPGSLKVSVQEQPTNRRSFFDDFFDDSFFSGNLFSKRIPKILGTDPIEIDVRPFPDAGKPSDFHGAAGKFSLTAEIDRRSVKQNEPVTVTITVEGEGNIETLERPNMKESPDFRSYEANVSTNLLKRQDAVMGRKAFEVVFIPLKSGTVMIPSATMSYFDPRNTKYVTVQSESFQIDVKPGDPDAALDLLPRDAQEENKKGIEIESRDIFFIKENIGPFPWEVLYPFLTLLLWLNGALTILVIALFLYQRSQEVLDADIARKRKKRAPRAVRRGLSHLRKLMKDDSVEESQKFCELAYKTVTSYMADRLNVSAMSVTVPELEQALREASHDEALAASLKSFFEVCDEARFIKTPVSRDKRRHLIQTIGQIVRFMEKRR